MSEISKELLEKLTNAKTREEAAALLKAEGIEDAPEEKIWEQVQQLRVPEDILSCSHDYPLKSNRPPCL